jgi:hypothetical protein
VTKTIQKLHQTAKQITSVIITKSQVKQIIIERATEHGSVFKKTNPNMKIPEQKNKNEFGKVQTHAEPLTFKKSCQTEHFW